MGLKHDKYIANSAISQAKQRKDGIEERAEPRQGRAFIMRKERHKAGRTQTTTTAACCVGPHLRHEHWPPPKVTKAATDRFNSLQEDKESRPGAGQCGCQCGSRCTAKPMHGHCELTRTGGLDDAPMDSCRADRLSWHDEGAPDCYWMRWLVLLHCCTRFRDQ